MQQLVLKDCEWALKNNNIKYNNHGLMLAIAILHAYVAFDHLSFSFSSSINIVIEKIISILNAVFDSQGFCNENTIGYHDFYLKTMRQLYDFSLIEQRFSRLATALSQYIDRAEKALHMTVWPCGGIPPIGDSGIYETKYPSINGSHFFKESGLYIHKTNDLYFSLICGARSDIHKHMDDTAITLRYKNKDLFIDSGFYNHDSNNHYRQCLGSQRGHSGLFFKKFDDYLRIPFIQNHQISADIAQRRKNGVDTLECHYFINDNQYTATRKVSFVSENTINIEDSWFSLTDEVPVQRFIVPNQAQIDIHHKHFIVTNGNTRAIIQFEQAIYIDQYCGQNADPLLGWASKKLNHIEPAYCLDVSTHSSVSSKFTIAVVDC